MQGSASILTVLFMRTLGLPRPWGLVRSRRPAHLARPDVLLHIRWVRLRPSRQQWLGRQVFSEKVQHGAGKGEWQVCRLFSMERVVLQAGRRFPELRWERRF